MPEPPPLPTDALLLTAEQRVALADVAFAAATALAWIKRYAPDASLNDILPASEREPDDPPLVWVLDAALAAYRATGATVVFPDEELADAD
jgi:hypothetical protein